MRRLMILLLTLPWLAACQAGKESPVGFSLPEGNPLAGKMAFEELQCNYCHQTADVAKLPDGSKDISVFLGGEVGRVKTYADLVTSVINPSHKLAPGYPANMISLGMESKMANYNSAMSVQQLIDVVAYLQPLYTLRVYEPTHYRGYHP